MGDRKYDNPNLLAAELLSTCLSHPNQNLRSEVFCQLIKQLTANPSNESSSRGWDLMVLCLHTFPPPSDFENFLEMYLRSFGNPPSKYVNAMHDALYGGAKSQAPQEREFHAILQAAHDNSAPRGRGYSAAAAAVPAAAPVPVAQPVRAAAPAAAPRPAMAPRPAAPRPAPRPAAPAVPEDTTTEWYYIDRSGSQKGPVLQAAIKSDWKAGGVDAECIAWNANLPDWVKINTIPTLQTYLQA